MFSTQVNSAFGACWLASPEVIIQVLAEEKQNYFPSRFDFRKGNSFNERGGCTEHKNGNKVWCNSI